MRDLLAVFGLIVLIVYGIGGVVMALAVLKRRRLWDKQAELREQLPELGSIWQSGDSSKRFKVISAKPITLRLGEDDNLHIKLSMSEWKDFVYYSELVKVN